MQRWRVQKWLLSQNGPLLKVNKTPFPLRVWERLCVILAATIKVTTFYVAETGGLTLTYSLRSSLDGCWWETDDFDPQASCHGGFVNMSWRVSCFSERVNGTEIDESSRERWGILCSSCCWTLTKFEYRGAATVCCNEFCMRRFQVNKCFARDIYTQWGRDCCLKEQLQLCLKQSIT